MKYAEDYEEYVSIDTAKLAKGAGFDVRIHEYYIDNIPMVSHQKDNHNRVYGDLKIEWTSRPTLTVLSNWITEKYNIEVIVHPVFHNKKSGYDSFRKIGYKYDLFSPNLNTNDVYFISFNTMELFPENNLENDEELTDIYNTKNEALDNALKEILKTKQV